jgi:hypothetical protein
MSGERKHDVQDMELRVDDLEPTVARYCDS